jgi:hypothetical protein
VIILFKRNTVVCNFDLFQYFIFVKYFPFTRPVYNLDFCWPVLLLYIVNFLNMVHFSGTGMGQIKIITKRESSSGLKRLGREAHHLPPSSAEVKNDCSYNFSLHIPSWCI